MAVVGEAHILVRAITTQVKKDIVSGLKGIKGQGTDIGKEFGRGFGGGLLDEMQIAQKGFTSLMRKSFVLQSGLGALVGSIGAVVGGLGALGGAALAAGSTLTIMANGMVALKTATSIGGMALKGVSQAVSAAGSSAGGAGNSVEDLKNKLEQLRLEARKASVGQKQAALDFEKARIAFERTSDLPEGDLRRRQASIDLEEARLNLDEAKQKNKEAKSELARGPQAAGGDPFADLTKTQKEFAQYLVTIQGKMDLLREATASAFLPELQKQLQSFIKRGFMGTLVESFTYLSEGLAKFTADFSRSFIDTENMRLLAETFRNVSTSLAGFGSVMGKTFEGFLYYLKNTNPLLNRFVTFLQFRSNKFASDMKNNSAGIQAFFKVAGDTAADFGTIFGNVWERIKRFIGNVIGPGSGGQLLLDWLKDASGNFKKFDKDVENAISRKYFQETAANMKVIGQSFDGLFTALLKLGSNPAVAGFWEALQGGQNALSFISTQAVETGPALGRVIASITEIIAALADAAQATAFFDTLNAVFVSIESLLSDMKPLLDAFGPLVGTLSAIGLVFLGLKKAGLIVGGFIILALKPLIATMVILGKTTAGAGGAFAIFSVKTQIALRAVSAAIIGVPVVGWILGIVTALGAAGTALAMWSSNTAEQTAEATRAVAKSGGSINKIFEEAKKNSFFATEGDPGAFFYEWSAGAEGTREKLDKLALAQANWLNAALVTGPATTDAAGQFERLGMGISEIFNEGGLPAASAAMAEWTYSQKLNEKQSLTAYKEMDSLREQIRGYAQDLGVDLVDAQAEYNFLLQDTSYQAKMAEIAQNALNQTINNAVSSFVDLNAPLQQNERNVEAWAKAHAKYNGVAGDSWKDYMKEFETTGFSTGYYMSKIRNQLNEAANYGKNLRIAQGKLGKEAFTALANMGKEGAGLVTAIASGNLKDADLTDIEKYLTTDYANIAGQIAASLDPASIAQAARTKYGSGNGWTQQIIDKLFKGELSAEEAMKTLGISASNLISTAISAQDTPEISAKWGANTIDNLRADLNNNFNANPITLYTKMENYKKDGGVIGESMRVNSSNAKVSWWPFKDGGRGGSIAGIGGPRADNIPAMLSVDEFVVNAAAARKNMALLTAINSGNASDLMAAAVSAAGGSTNNIGITVNAAPGMNTDEIVSEVERRLAFQLRRGVNV
jgi:hypothetical protein